MHTEWMGLAAGKLATGEGVRQQYSTDTRVATCSACTDTSAAKTACLRERWIEGIRSGRRVGGAPTGCYWTHTPGMSPAGSGGRHAMRRRDTGQRCALGGGQPQELLHTFTLRV
jgi:hypothetical protein